MSCLRPGGDRPAEGMESGGQARCRIPGETGGEATMGRGRDPEANLRACDGARDQAVGVDAQIEGLVVAEATTVERDRAARLQLRAVIESGIVVLGDGAVADESGSEQGYGVVHGQPSKKDQPVRHLSPAALKAPARPE